MISLKEYTAARDALTEKDFTKAGLPKVSALNVALRAAGQGEIDGTRRDELESAHEAGPDDAEPTSRMVLIESAMTNPVTMRLNGQDYRLRVGFSYTLPPEVVAGLRDSHVKFTILE